MRAAISLADRDGLGAVSIRRVAADLEVRPMSLYTHVASKDDLLCLMAEEVVAEVIVPPPLPPGWRPALTAIATHSHETFKRHPWLPAITRHRPNLGQNAVRHAEQLLGALSELRVEPTKAWQILYTVNDLTLGHALRIAHAPSDENPENYPPFDSGEFPLLQAALKRPASPRDDSTFHAGLELLLDGIQLRHTTASQ